MPGQRLTREQATRLYGVGEAQCRQALDRLVDTRFLCVKPDGTYARAFDGADTPRRNPAKADHRSGMSSAKISA
jgi:DNA-binding GntR family transcriptional regulator